LRFDETEQKRLKETQTGAKAIAQVVALIGRGQKFLAEGGQGRGWQKQRGIIGSAAS